MTIWSLFSLKTFIVFPLVRLCKQVVTFNYLRYYFPDLHLNNIDVFILNIIKYRIKIDIYIYISNCYILFTFFLIRKIIIQFLVNCIVADNIRLNMKNVLILSFITLVFTTSCSSERNAWIRINQLGYRTDDIKVAVFLSKKALNLQS